LIQKSVGGLNQQSVGRDIFLKAAGFTLYVRYKKVLILKCVELYSDYSYANKQKGG